MKKYCSHVPTRDKQLKGEIHDYDTISRLANSETSNTNISIFGVYVCVILFLCRLYTYEHARARAHTHTHTHISTGYWVHDRGVRVRVPVGSRIFCFHVVRLGTTHFPVKWVPQTLSPEVKDGRDFKLTTHLQLVPK
jgi:hypothetical protein